MKTRAFILFLFFSLGNLFAQYTTPDTGVKWTLDSIALHAPYALSVSGDTYSLVQDLELAANDSLLLDKNLRLEIDSDIEINVRGYFSSNSEEIVITAIDTENPYKGFWFYDTSEAYFNNTLIEYGGGLKVVTPNFFMENCEVSNNNNDSGSSSGSAISFSNGRPVIHNTVFMNNIHPALSSGANTSVALQLYDSYFESNNLTNNNRPQINMGPSGIIDTTRIINNSIIGNRDLDKVGGLSVSSMVGVVNTFEIKGNTIRDNRYGITSMGAVSSGYIKNNILEDNDNETNPMNGGSGIALYGTGEVYITGNEIRRHLWGITLITETGANLGSDDEEDFNPGGNIFSENGNGGVIYALYNNTPDTVKALHNCWIEGQNSTAEEVEEVIVHQADDATLGEVFYDPFDCGEDMGLVEISDVAFTVYPNPAHSYFHVNAPESGMIRIYNLNGQLIQNKNLDKGKHEIQINFSKGIYLVEFIGKDKRYTQKLIVNQ